MSSLIFFLYRWGASPVAWLILQVGSWFGGEKWRTFVTDKNRKNFHFNRPWDVGVQRPFWIHAASGEIEYARPVLRELKRRFPQIPILVTYTSPSAKRLVQGLSEVDAWGPAPWEFDGDVRDFLRRFQPRALLIARTDLWPVMIETSASAGVPAILFAATFAADSSRIRGLARFLTARSLAHLRGVHLVSTDDGKAIANLIDLQKTEVRGDTRFDQVLHRLSHPKPLTESLFAPSSRPILVAGSTWPEDEDQILPAFTTAKSHWRMVLAPHDFNEARLSALEARMQKQGLKVQRYSSGGSWQADVLLIDQIGILAEIYAWGNLAFVGGSFRKQVHSVMEPLAAGLPVLVGPKHMNNREAIAFQKEKTASGRTCVQVVHSADEISQALADWQPLVGTDRDPDSIREKIRYRQGATQAVLQWCESFVSK